MTTSLDSADPTRIIAPHWIRRMACWLYEGLLLFGVAFIFGYLFSTLSQSRHALSNRIGLQAFLFLIFGIYFTWFGHKGQTLAMKTWHIRLVDKSGDSVTQRRALFRYFLSWIWFLPALASAAFFEISGPEISVVCLGWVIAWALMSRLQREGQFWHDIWAGTRLVSTSP
jgi:uncharacterized RDD family membrane protein YckC